MLFLFRFVLLKAHPEAVCADIQMKPVLVALFVTQFLALVVKGQQTLVIDNEVSESVARKRVDR